MPVPTYPIICISYCDAFVLLPVPTYFNNTHFHKKKKYNNTIKLKVFYSNSLISKLKFVQQVLSLSMFKIIFKYLLCYFLRTAELALLTAVCLYIILNTYIIDFECTYYPCICRYFFQRHSVG